MASAMDQATDEKDTRSVREILEQMSLEEARRIQHQYDFLPIPRFAPLGDRVIIFPDPEERQTAGGVIIPDGVSEKPNRGTVVKVGPGAIDPVSGRLIAMNVQQGDAVIYGKRVGSIVCIDAIDFCVMREKDIIGFLRPEEKIQMQDLGDWLKEIRAKATA